MWQLVLTLLITLGPSPAGDAEELYEVGQRLFHEGDFAGCIVIWQRALEAVGDAAELEASRQAIAFNLAVAHREAYGKDGDVAHLHKAIELLRDFAASLSDGRQPSGGDLGERCQKELDELTALLAVVEADHSESDDVEPIVDEISAPLPPAPASAKPASAESGPELGPRDPATRTLAIVSGTLWGTSVVALAAMTGALVVGARADRSVEDPQTSTDARRAAMDWGYTANEVALGTGITAGVLVVAAAVCTGLFVGKRKRESARVSPTAGGFRLRF